MGMTPWCWVQGVISNVLGLIPHPTGLGISLIYNSIFFVYSFILYSSYLAELEQLEHCLFDFLVIFSLFYLDSNDLALAQGHSYYFRSCDPAGSSHIPNLKSAPEIFLKL